MMLYIRKMARASRFFFIGLAGGWGGLGGLKVGDREGLVKVKVRVWFRARQDKNRQDEARKHKTTQDKTRQHKTKQDQTKQ